MKMSSCRTALLAGALVCFSAALGHAQAPATAAAAPAADVRLTVNGDIDKPLSLSLADLRGLPVTQTFDEFVYPGSGGPLPQAFARTTTHRNIYRIPLHL